MVSKERPGLLDRRQRAVLFHPLELAGQPVAKSPAKPAHRVLVRGDGRDADDHRPLGPDARQFTGQCIERALTAKGAEGRAQVPDSQAGFHAHVLLLLWWRVAASGRTARGQPGGEARGIQVDSTSPPEPRSMRASTVMSVSSFSMSVPGGQPVLR